MARSAPNAHPSIGPCCGYGPLGPKRTPLHRPVLRFGPARPQTCAQALVEASFGPARPQTCAQALFEASCGPARPETSAAPVTPLLRVPVARRLGQRTLPSSRAAERRWRGLSVLRSLTCACVRRSRGLSALRSLSFTRRSIPSLWPARPETCAPAPCRGIVWARSVRTRAAPVIPLPRVPVARRLGQRTLPSPRAAERHWHGLSVLRLITCACKRRSRGLSVLRSLTCACKRRSRGLSALRSLPFKRRSIPSLWPARPETCAPAPCRGLVRARSVPKRVHPTSPGSRCGPLSPKTHAPHQSEPPRRVRRLRLLRKLESCQGTPRGGIRPS